MKLLKGFRKENVASRRWKERVLLRIPARRESCRGGGSQHGDLGVLRSAVS